MQSVLETEMISLSPESSGLSHCESPMRANCGEHKFSLNSIIELCVRCSSSDPAVP